MSNINRLDAVWASMTTGDRIVLLGHDRDYLDESDKARLTALLAANSNRGVNRPNRNAPVRRGHRTPRRARTSA